MLADKKRGAVGLERASGWEVLIPFNANAQKDRRPAVSLQIAETSRRCACLRLWSWVTIFGSVCFPDQLFRSDNVELSLRSDHIQIVQPNSGANLTCDIGEVPVVRQVDHLAVLRHLRE